MVGYNFLSKIVKLKEARKNCPKIDSKSVIELRIEGIAFVEDLIHNLSCVSPVYNLFDLRNKSTHISKARIRQN